ncbi:hypothetical protein KIN20_029122 [Parelaphostrongylus tenuis]|uniref:Uncharacterized protein n=1 Tax=Parelaphostrongylus tenuis TaxID=148309 RepID=A0AAD5R246_PARTN|nr:hypothetical protein KIN20_029122 [Parelaphostrongylus tenuis]
MGKRRVMIVVMMAALVILSTISISVADHPHSHEPYEPPHAKYTREINEQAAREALSSDHLHHRHHHDHGSSGGGCPHAHTNGKPVDISTRSRSHLWTYAIGATLLISTVPFFLLIFIPIQNNSPSNEPWLKVLLAFGSGGLLGDAFLHLIPHATPSSSHSHSHSALHHTEHTHEPHDMSVGAWVLAGITTFLLVEKVVRIIRGEAGHSHSHSHSHSTASKKKAKHSDDESDETSESVVHSRKEDTSLHATRQKSEGVKVAAYLNLVADFAHNFTDGLAIGASFVAGTTVGVVTMMTVLVHEVPHEIGDFAILIQSGYSKKRAMAIQLVTALGALSGCAVSLWAGDPSALAEAAASSWILPFTAGGFIYIATVSVLPDLLENSTTGQSFREILAILTGILMMYFVARFE